MSQSRSATDWALFIILTWLWGSAYAFTRYAVNPTTPEQGVPPELIVTGRLALGSVILIIIALMSGQKWPTFREWKSWLAMFVMGAFGTVVPFFVISVAQQDIPSSLAGFYLASMPLFVVLIAPHLFPEEKLTPQIAMGVLVGFLGVGVLFGPSAFGAFGTASMVAQALCLVGTVFYAVATLTARYGSKIPHFVFAAGFNTMALIASLFLLPGVDFSALNPAPSAIWGVVALGLLPTALASVLLMILVSRTSATFVGLSSYCIPVVAGFLGFVLFGETQSWTTLLALALILCGIWLAQRTAPEAID